MPSPTPSQPRYLAALREIYLHSSPEHGIYLGDPTAHGKTRWLPMEGAGADGHVLATHGDDDEALSPASLLAVLRITSEDNWTIPDGNWKGPRAFTKHFADVKLTCTGAQPPSGVFRGDYSHVVENLKRIQDMIAVAGCEKKKGLLVRSKHGDPSGGLKVKFQHALFEVRFLTTIAILVDQPRWNIDNWPATTEKAKRELEAMRTTHIVDPLPLYDFQARLVHPELCKKSLIGATVEVTFNLCHWHFNRNNKDVYVAYIDKMHILPVPAQVLSLPGKIRSDHKVEPPTLPRDRVALRK
ncbi:hypothetical protein EDD18DRAFT_1282340 [Armillaria luteobubalina]|uniref:Uncharacterized protein n=1 Tax=Armillaria luteobubalina TaxID=153913 RepID=A0AA39URL1_9AGAR|nr:hypothetical protein EDD18DRAFT_1282340 [Armillaria luteobubalina]